MTAAAVKAWVRQVEVLGSATTGDGFTIDAVHAEERSRARGYLDEIADYTGAAGGWDLTPDQADARDARWAEGRWTPARGRQDGHPVPLERWPASWRLEKLQAAGRAFLDGLARHAQILPGPVCPSIHREDKGKPRSWRCQLRLDHAGRHRSITGHRTWE